MLLAYDDHTNLDLKLARSHRHGPAHCDSSLPAALRESEQRILRALTSCGTDATDSASIESQLPDVKDSGGLSAGKSSNSHQYLSSARFPLICANRSISPDLLPGSNSLSQDTASNLSPASTSGMWGKSLLPFKAPDIANRPELQLPIPSSNTYSGGIGGLSEGTHEDLHGGIRAVNNSTSFRTEHGVRSAMEVGMLVCDYTLHIIH